MYNMHVVQAILYPPLPHTYIKASCSHQAFWVAAAAASQNSAPVLHQHSAGSAPKALAHFVLSALGFNGDSTFLGGAPTPVLAPPAVTLEGSGMSPVTLRRIGGRILDVPCPGCCFPAPALTPRAEVSPPPPDFSENPENDAVSVPPSACRRAFSCFAWTERKCRRSSCHLISSRPSLDRVASGPAVLVE